MKKRAKFQIPTKWANYVDVRLMLSQVKPDAEMPFLVMFEKTDDDPFSAMEPVRPKDRSFLRQEVIHVVQAKNPCALAYVEIADIIDNTTLRRERFVTCHLQYWAGKNLEHRIYALRGNGEWQKHPFEASVDKAFPQALAYARSKHRDTALAT